MFIVQNYWSERHGVRAIPGKKKGRGKNNRSVTRKKKASSDWCAGMVTRKESENAKMKKRKKKNCRSK